MTTAALLHELFNFDELQLLLLCNWFFVAGAE